MYFAPTDGGDGVQIERLAVQMHGQQGLGARRDGRFDQPGIEVERGIINIHIDRPRAAIGNSPTGGNERERRGDDFIARADIVEAHGHVQRRSAAVEAERVFDVAIGGEVLFKLGHIRAEAKGTVIECARKGGVEFFTDAANLRGQIQVGNFVRHDGIN